MNWEVVAPITASPRMIVIRPGQADFRVLIQSRDKTTFKVTRVECDAPGIQAHAASTAAGPMQSIAVSGIPRPAKERGVVTVFTDHPAQAKVELPFVVIE